MIHSLLEGENLSQLIEVVLLPENGEGGGDCTAVLTIPDGFLESVLNGENRSPILLVKLESPLEAMWLRQMAISGARALTGAQHSIYAALEQAQSTPGMDEQRYNFVLADVNLTFLSAFLQRLALLQTKTLSAVGGLTLFQHYLSAIGICLLFCYGFLFHPAIWHLRRFVQASGAGRFSLFLAGALHLLLLQAVFLLPVLLCFSGGVFFGSFWQTLAVLTLLSSGVALFTTLLFPSAGLCSAACLLLTLGQALLGGLLIPLALLPQAFTALAPFLPLWQGAQLLTAAFGAPLAPQVPLCMALLFFCGAWLLWMRKGGKR